jgi:hypothetical protein
MSSWRFNQSIRLTAYLACVFFEEGKLFDGRLNITLNDTTNVSRYYSKACKVLKHTVASS